ncbi:LytTR family transcriptional regulator DNA-binding domain-containing protein [Paenibacillus graminis]|uniref:HTH LytTR-type domain-containing protein n=1 Tax=Paenibacillus graminis TaxID=189425 RepID=A0A089MD95_9BACL|nr:LytTR family transcriptional regulator DNA-binding domain-containing protein [Paenibacillus graminis]AIQ70335.1 hypothetical protein PGRAT_23860 [Paenibacillus graminis]
MNYLTVTENENGAGLQQLLIDEILYMQFDNGVLISIYTDRGHYYTVGPLRFWESAFGKVGLNFIRLDRGVLANLNKIKAVDSEYKIAYFDTSITRDTKRCTMSTGGYKALHDAFGISQKSSITGIKMLKGLSWQTSP